MVNIDGTSVTVEEMTSMNFKFEIPKYLGITKLYNGSFFINYCPRDQD
jgi:riboflavin synthase alpha subunit